MGTIVEDKTRTMRTIRVGNAEASASYSPLTSLLSNDKFLKKQTIISLVECLCLSHSTFNCHIWPTLWKGELKAFSQGVLGLWRKALGMQTYAEEPSHYTDAEVTADAEQLTPQQILSVARLRYFKQLRDKGPMHFGSS